MQPEVQERVTAIFESYFEDELKPYLADTQALALFSEVDPVDSCEVSIATIDIEQTEETEEGMIGKVEMMAQLLVNEQYSMHLGLRFEEIDLLESNEDPLYPVIKKAVNQNLFESVLQGLKKLDSHIKEKPQIVH